jgi:hypothetical protein
MSTAFVIGLDLGQVNDYTALAVVERHTEPGWPADSSHALRHVQRLALGTPYPLIVPFVARLANAPPLAGRTTLVVDHTGVGRAVVDLLRGALPGVPLVPITITAGKRTRVDENGLWHVPKKELVMSLQTLLHNHQLKVARTLPDAQVLIRELLDFRVKTTEAANETFGAWRTGQHDDLVLAVALACWQAGRGALRTSDEQDQRNGRLPAKARSGRYPA